MAAAISISVDLVGIAGKLGDVQARPDTSITALRRQVAEAIGAESPHCIRLSLGTSILRDRCGQQLSDVIGHATSSVELMVLKLNGPEELNGNLWFDFQAAVKAATEVGDKLSARLSFSLESLRVLDLSGNEEWIGDIVLRQYPNSDCVGEEHNFSAFIGALQEMRSLVELNLSGNPFSQQCLDPEFDFPDSNPCTLFAKALPSTLEVLTLGFSAWWCCEELDFFAAGWAQRAPLSHLQELRLARQDMSAKDRYTDLNSEQFSKGLAKCLAFMPALEQLVLDDCRLRHKHLPLLAPAVPRTVKSLSLLQNFCVDAEDGAAASVQALVAELPKLAELHLSVAEAGVDECAACRGLRGSLAKGCVLRCVPPGPPPPLLPPEVPEAPCVLGLWASADGEINLFRDKMTGQLMYVEFLGDGSQCLRGTLSPAGGGAWQGELLLMEAGQPPWYGPSCGEKPEAVGEVSLAGSSEAGRLEVRIREAEGEDWAPPVLFRPAEG